MLRIATDMDGVFADFTGEICARHSAITGKRVTPNEIFTFDTWENLPLSRHVMDRQGWIDAQMSSVEFWENLPVLDRNFKQVFWKLRDAGHEVIIASAMPRCAPEAAYIGKVRWLQRELPFIDTTRLFWPVKDKHMVDADVLLDDGVHNLEKFPGVRVAMDQPWNRDFRADARVRDWLEFERLVHDIEA